jgi:hypothetical protein
MQPAWPEPSRLGVRLGVMSFLLNYESLGLIGATKQIKKKDLTPDLVDFQRV